MKSLILTLVLATTSLFAYECTTTTGKHFDLAVDLTDTKTVTLYNLETSTTNYTLQEVNAEGEGSFRFEGTARYQLDFVNPHTVDGKVHSLGLEYFDGANLVFEATCYR